MEDMPRLELRSREDGKSAGHEDNCGTRAEERRGAEGGMMIEELNPLIAPKSNNPCPN